MQYHETLPLRDHEVVLTFDDGPLPPKTNRILDVLASECVKATFFSVGKMAQTFPALLRREYAEGHSIGTHSQNHPLNFQRAPMPVVQQEVEEGIASVTAALGDAKDLSPFFRVPGLLREAKVEDYLNQRGLMIWSADFPADDWKHIKASEVYRRALTRIEARHKGILLLHDIQPATVAALPMLLKELKRRGYHIVHVAPATADQPKTTTDPSQWLMSGKKPVWTPEVVSVDTSLTAEPVTADPAPVTLSPLAAPAAAPELHAAIVPTPALTAPILPALTITPPSTTAPLPTSPTAPSPSTTAPILPAPMTATPTTAPVTPAPVTAAPVAPTPLTPVIARMALRGPIPLPPERPRLRGERAALRTIPLPPRNPQAIGHMGVPKPVEERSELITGSVGSTGLRSTIEIPAEPPAPATSAANDEPILRPSAEIPPPKAPVTAANPPKTGTP